MKNEIWQLLFPPRCPLCERVLQPEEIREYVCEDCAKAVRLITPPMCYQCGKPLRDERTLLCPGCAGKPHLYLRGQSALRYEGRVRDAMTRLKFHGKTEYVSFFAQAMARQGEDFLRRYAPAVIWPVPMYGAKRRRRGFDQSVLLAKALSSYTGIPLETDRLIRVRATRAQKGLDLAGRRANLQGAFRLQRKEGVREPILLVDDIYTSGTTMDCICEELRHHGITRIYFLTACSAAGQNR